MPQVVLADGPAAPGAPVVLGTWEWYKGRCRWSGTGPTVAGFWTEALVRCRLEEDLAGVEAIQDLRRRRAGDLPPPGHHSAIRGLRWAARLLAGRFIGDDRSWPLHWYMAQLRRAPRWA